MRKLIPAAVVGAALFGLSAAVAVSAPGAAAARPAAASTPRVIVQDIQVRVPGEPAVPAYVVRTAGRLAPRSHAGILFLHWLGQIHSDRTEFLAEAVALAGHGVVSILPQGTFPWVLAPAGTKRDVTAIRDQLKAFQACLNALLADRSVDRSRVAVVGHDYGAMYGALLASGNPRVHAAVLATPDATWGHWFVKYWLGFTGQRAARYDALFASLQPVRHASGLGGRELFQWAGQDIYVSAGIRKQFAAAAPRALVNLYPQSDHQLTDAARADRDKFLIRVLDLP